MGTERSAGLVWAWDRQGGRPAVFEPGQELFCPAVNQKRPGAVRACGHSLQIWAGHRMVVRPVVTGAARVLGASRFYCRVCHHWSEVYAMRETLEATG